MMSSQDKDVVEALMEGCNTGVNGAKSGSNENKELDPKGKTKYQMRL